MSSEIRWQPVEGTRFSMLPLERKPDATCSNTYLLCGPSALLVIDPGADPAQTAEINRQIAVAAAERVRPVMVLLTHCHRDHALAIGAVAAPAGAPLRLAHAAGAAAIAAGDEQLTLSYLHEARFPAVMDMRPLLPLPAAPGGGLPAPAPLKREWASGAQLIGARLDFGPEEALEIYQTPGHSPDGLSIRAGSVLFMGDLLFAVQPMIAGAYGWNRDDLLRSLAGIAALIESGAVRWCCPGHGRAVPGDKALPVLKSSIERARQLAEIATLDSARARRLKEYTRVILGEAGRLLTILAGRLYTLAYRLEQLEEGPVAAGLLAALDLEAMDRYLNEFGGYVREYEAGHFHPAVPLKGLQIVRKLEEALARSLPAPVAELALFGRIRRLLQDFVNTLQGFEHAELADPADAVAVLRRLAAGLKPPSWTEAAAFAAADNPDMWRDELIRQVSYLPLFKAVDVCLTIPPEPLRAAVDADRLQDVLLNLVEPPAVAGARAITLAAGAPPTVWNCA